MKNLGETFTAHHENPPTRFTLMECGFTEEL